MSEMRNRTIVVDTNIYLYKFSMGNSLIENMYLMLSLFEQNNITPIFIFDGKPPSEKKKLIPTEIGKRTSKFLNENFEELMTYSFTSKLEENLDEIVNDKINWSTMLQTFYSSFEPKVKLLKSSESKSEAYKKKEDSKRNLGVNNKNESVFAYVGKYGPVLQFVDIDDDKKVRFQKLEDYDVNDVTLEQVNNIKNADFPKELGKNEGKEVYLKKGKYGLYLEWNKKNYKIINDYDENITFEQS